MRMTLTALAAVATLVTTAAADEWWDNVKVKGDLRYRHEMIDEEGQDARHRHRLRARVGIKANVSATTKACVQLATGSDDPVSTNQTLGNGFSTKSLMLDMAYFETKHQAVPGLSVKGGKFGNPFFKPGKSELLWDSDWNPEGGVAVLEKDVQDFSLTLLGAGLWIEERSSTDDSWLAAGQGVMRYHVNEKRSSVVLGVAFFNFVHGADFEPFFDPTEPLGNSVSAAVDSDGDTTWVYDNDYELLELYAEATHRFGNIPVVITSDFVTNTAADSFDNGWLLGVRIGETKKPGSWAIRYIYREVEKDAVVGTFTDSDFRGGGSDAKGHEIGSDVQLAENTAFKVTYFWNTIGLNEEGSDFRRLQVDLQLKFN